MHRTPRSKTLGLVAFLVASPGCKGNKEPPPPEVAAAALAGMSALPASIDQVVGLDVGRLARSPLVGRAVTALLAGDPTLARDLAALLDGCQIDVARDVRRLWLGMDRDGGDRVMLVAEGQLGEGQLGSCVGNAISAAGGRLTVERVAGRTHYHVDQPDGRPDVWFAVAGEGVVAVASSAELLAEGVGQGPKLATVADLMGLIGRAGVDHAVWFAGGVPPEIGAGLGKASGGALAAPRSMFGHLQLDGSLAAELGVEMASADDAGNAVSILTPQLQTLALVAQERGLGRLVNQIKVVAADRTLFLRLAASEAEVREALGTPIDTGGAADQNATPSEREPGETSDGQGDPAPGDEAPVR